MLVLTRKRNERVVIETPRRQRALERRWHIIYLLYDAKDRLIYVGISAQGLSRLNGHSQSSPWFRKVVGAEIEHVKGRTAAEARELELIRERNPRFNVRGKEAA
jgi:hypothetical protein